MSAIPYRNVCKIFFFFRVLWNRRASQKEDTLYVSFCILCCCWCCCFLLVLFLLLFLFVYRVHKNDENVCTTSCNFAHNILGPWNVSWRGRRIFDVKKIFSKIAMSNPRNLWTYEYHMKNTLNVLFGQTSQDERLVHNLYTESEKSVLRSLLWNVSSWNVLW